jgi:hypothetical protein
MVQATKADQQDVVLPHRRLGHAGKSTMGEVIAKHLGTTVRACNLKGFECPACIKGNCVRLASLKPSLIDLSL